MMRSRMGRAVAGAGVLLAMLLAARPAGAEVPARAPGIPVITLAAEAGFGGYVKRQGWMPVRISIISSESVDGEVVIDDGQADGDRLYSTVSIARGARRNLTLYSRAHTGSATVRFLISGAEFASVPITTRQLAEEDRLVLVASEPADGYNFLGELRTAVGGKTYIAQLPVAQLPTRVAALASVDVLIVNNVDTAALSESQRQTLRAWVVSGGHLMLSGGPGGRLTANGLADLAPARTVAINDTSPSVLQGLRTFAGASRPINLTDIPTATTSVPLAGLQLTTGSAQVMIGSPDTPLVVRRRIGRGLVDQFAFDATLAPLRDWVDRASAFNALFGGRVSIAQNNGLLRSEPSALTAARALPSAALPPFLVVAGFLGLYVIAIGPLNFYLLRRFQRQSWAWLSIPAIVTVFTLAGLLAGVRFRSAAAQIHRLTLTLGDAQVSDGAVQSFVGLFAPRRVTLDVDMGRGLVDPVRENSNPGDPNTPITLREGETNTLRDVTINSSTTRAFFARGETPLPKITPDLRLILGRTQTETARLEGAITNGSNSALYDCSIIAGGDFQSFRGPFAPGDKLAISLSLSQRRNRPIIYPSADRLPTTAFSIGGSTFSGYGSVRVGKLFSTGNSLADSLLAWRSYGANRLLDRRDRDMLSAALGDTHALVSTGVALACWDDADHSGARAAQTAATDHGVLLWELPVAPALADSGDLIQADLLNWNVIYSSSSVSAGLGEVRLDNGRHIFAFSPWAPLRLGSASARVNVHLEFSSATRRQLLRDTIIWLYDWRKAEFVRARPLVGSSVDDVSFTGDVVSPSGEIRVMMDAPADAVIEMQDLVVYALVQ